MALILFITPVMAGTISYCEIKDMHENKPTSATQSPESQLFTHNLYDRYAKGHGKNYGSISYPHDEDVMSLIMRIDEITYLRYLENITAFGARVTGTRACDEASAYLYKEFENIGLDNLRKQYWSYGDLHGTNIEATLPGINNSSDEIYIVCAHYDTAPGSPGADDDGSGVAAVLSIAKAMSHYAFNHTIRFVLFSGEEQGKIGSYYYVQEAKENNDRIVATLNVDMIGYAPISPRIEHENYDKILMTLKVTMPDYALPYQIYVLTCRRMYRIKVYSNPSSKWIADFTVTISKEYFEYITLKVVTRRHSGGGDHVRFYEAGYDAVFYNEYLPNLWYHSQEDTIEKLNIEYATKVSRLITATLACLSEIVALYSYCD
jgi:hypothetical protein